MALCVALLGDVSPAFPAGYWYDLYSLIREVGMAGYCLKEEMKAKVFSWLVSIVAGRASLILLRRRW